MGDVLTLKPPPAFDIRSAEGFVDESTAGGTFAFAVVAPTSALTAAATGTRNAYFFIRRSLNAAMLCAYGLTLQANSLQ